LQSFGNLEHSRAMERFRRLLLLQRPPGRAMPIVAVLGA